MGHVGVGGSGSGDSGVMEKKNCPLRGVGSGPVVPATVTAVSCPGATFPPGFWHSTVATPGAAMVISKGFR